MKSDVGSRPTLSHVRDWAVAWRAKGLLARIVLLAGSCLVGVAGFELFLRCFFPLHLAGPVGLYEYDPELGVRVRPGIHLLRTTDHQEEIYTNTLGTVNFQPSFTGYEQLVFAVGDSYTQGTGLPADAAYPFQLDLLLNMTKDGYREMYGVVNLGLAAYGGRQNLMCLHRYAAALGSPQFILYLGCNNDQMDDRLFTAGDRHRHLVDGNPYWGPWLKPLQWLGCETEIGKRLRRAAGEYRRTRRTRVSSTDAPAKDEPCVAERQEAVLSQLQDTARELNATLIVGWADGAGDSWRSYQWLHVWAESHGVAFADWYTSVQSVCRAIPNVPTENPHSAGHHRTWVNTLIARSFAAQIQASD